MRLVSYNDNIFFLVDMKPGTVNGYNCLVMRETIFGRFIFDIKMYQSFDIEQFETIKDDNRYYRALIKESFELTSDNFIAWHF
jgi:hypothetical protein